MAELQDMMTNEVLMNERFNSRFDLVLYAIGRVTTMVKSGISPRVRTSVGNPAYQVLEEIAQKRDVLNNNHFASQNKEKGEPEMVEQEAESSLS